MFLQLTIEKRNRAIENKVMRETSMGRICLSISDRFVSVTDKSKLKLKSNSREILPVDCKFICDSSPNYADNTKT